MNSLYGYMIEYETYINMVSFSALMICIVFSKENLDENWLTNTDLIIGAVVGFSFVILCLSLVVNLLEKGF